MAKTGSPPARPRIVAVAQQKGGTGKTTIVCNVAAAIARIDPTVQTVIVDLDSQGSSSLQMTGHAHADVGSWDYVIAGRMPRGFIRRTHVDTCLIIPATQRLLLSDADILSQDLSYPEVGRRMRANMRSVDLILIDCPAGFGAVSTLAMAVADIVLMPTQPAFFAVKSLRQTVRHMERLRRDAAERCAIALSMVDADSPVHATIADHIRAEFGSMVLHTPLPLDPAAEEAAATNTLVTETAPGSAIARAFAAFAVDVLRRARVQTKADLKAFALDPVPAPTPKPAPTPAPTSEQASDPQPDPTPAPASADLPPIPPPPSLGGPAVGRTDAPRLAETNAPPLSAPPPPPEAVPRPRLPASPHAPPPAAAGEEALDPIPAALRERGRPDADADTRDADTRDADARGDAPVSVLDALEGRNAAAATPPTPKPRRRWRTALGWGVALAAFAATAVLVFRLVDTADALLALGATALVAVPILGYVFYVLKRV
jgi:chromosome partitioning protein